MQTDNTNWEQTTIKDLLYQTINEKRRTRRWQIFFKLIFLLLIIGIFFILIENKNKNIDHIAIIEINGVISEKSQSSAKNIINMLNDAFNNKYAKTIILKINSPGGTPVQSNIIHNYIKKLRKSNKNKQIFAVIEDIGASGAYLIAVAAEKIYCDPSSIVGSIGVVLNSFGFVEIINKLGIERRLYKSGEHKAMMDPFLEKKIDEDKFIQHNLNIIHQNFINIVKKNRFNNDRSYNSEIFSGKFWIGKDALDLGLIDGFYDIYTLSSNIIKINTLIDYNIATNIFDIFEKRINKIITK